MHGFELNFMMECVLSMFTSMQKIYPIAQNVLKLELFSMNLWLVGLVGLVGLVCKISPNVSILCGSMNLTYPVSAQSDKTSLCYIIQGFWLEGWLDQSACTDFEMSHPL